MYHPNILFIFIFLKLSVALALVPHFGVLSRAANGVMTTTTTSWVETTDADTVSNVLPHEWHSLLLSVAERSENLTKQGLINWENPGEAIFGSITLLYIAFSIAAGLKYVFIDGWRPTLK